MADLLTGRFGESAGRFIPLISAGRYSDSQQLGTAKETTHSDELGPGSWETSAKEELGGVM